MGDWENARRDHLVWLAREKIEAGVFDGNTTDMASSRWERGGVVT
jgi:hypothetical protein